MSAAISSRMFHLHYKWIYNILKNLFITTADIADKQLQIYNEDVVTAANLKIMIYQ